MDSFACRHVSKFFGGVRALHDVSIEFPATGVVALVGPNGAGKTTLFNILTGFTHADSGQCFLGGLNIGKFAAHRIAALGVARTFQEVRLIRRESVIDNVLLALSAIEPLAFVSLAPSISVDNKNRAVAVLEQFGLGDRSNAKAGELSYGQQKLLSIACCVATRRRVFLFDEPVTGVDPSMSSRIVGLIRQLGADGHLAIVIEHDVPAVTSLADHVVVMAAGVVIDSGEPGDVFARPETLRAYRG